MNRFIVCFFLLIMLVVSPAKGDQTQARVEAFLSDLSSVGAQKALGSLREDHPHFSNEVDFSEYVAKLDHLQKLFGDVASFALLSDGLYGEKIRQLVYAIYYKDFYVVWKFGLFFIEGKWSVVSMQFQTDGEYVSPLSLSDEKIPKEIRESVEGFCSLLKEGDVDAAVDGFMGSARVLRAINTGEALRIALKQQGLLYDGLIGGEIVSAKYISPRIAEIRASLYYKRNFVFFRVIVYQDESQKWNPVSLSMSRAGEVPE